MRWMHGGARTPSTASRRLMIASRYSPPARAVLIPLLLPGGGMDGCPHGVLGGRKLLGPGFPTHTQRLTEAAAHMRASGARGTIIASWEEWRSELGLRRGRGPDVVAGRRLGRASDCLPGRRRPVRRSAEARRAFRDCNVLAVRRDCRRRSH